MSAKTCVVVVTHKGIPDPVVMFDGKSGGLMSKKDAQRQATAQVQQMGAFKAEVFERVLEVNS